MRDDNRINQQASLSSKDALYRTMLDDVMAWGRAGYPAVACGRYKDAAELIHRQSKQIEQLQRDIETGFMPGAYARLKELQEIERKYYERQSFETKPAIEYGRIADAYVKWLNTGYEAGRADKFDAWYAGVSWALGGFPVKAKDDWCDEHGYRNVDGCASCSSEKATAQPECPCPPCERLRASAKTDERRKAPWPDFAGAPIFEGDTLVHPDGHRGRVLFLEGYENDAWRVDYGDGNQSRLCLQIGDKGRASVTNSRIGDG